MFSNFVQIPVLNKRPIVLEWKDIKKTPDDIADIIRTNPGARRANIAGKLNNIIVVDIDKPKGDEIAGAKFFDGLMEGNQKTLSFETQSMGRHYYFKYDDDIKDTMIRLKKIKMINGKPVLDELTKKIVYNVYSIDILSNGKYAVSYDNIIDDVPIQPLPKNIKDFIMSTDNYKNRTNKKRNDTDKPENSKPKANITNNIHFRYKLEDVVDLLNKLPEKYYEDNQLWKNITSALKSANLHKEWEDFSKKSVTEYDDIKNNKIWLNNSLNIDLTYLNIVAKNEGIKTKLKVSRWCDKLDLFTTTPNETRHVEYVELVKTKEKPEIQDFNYDRHPYILIKSATGTGKTQCTSELITKIRGEYNYKVLSIVSRISLAEQHKTNFEKIGIVSYQDIEPKDYGKYKNLVIQIDSIVHLKVEWLKNTIVYLDEINSLLDYVLNSSTLVNKRLDVYNKLCMIVKSASYVIGVDADLSDIVTMFFKNLKIKPYIIHNTFKNAKGNVTQYLCEHKLIADMKAKLKRGEKFICCFDSLRYQEIVVEELRQYCKRMKLDREKDFLMYSSKDGDDASLKDVKESWDDKYVFYTPKIVYGVDFVPKQAMPVYAFFKCTSINPLAFSQMVSRCRKISHLRYFIEERNHNLQFTCAEDIKDHYKDVLTYINDFTKAIEENDKKKKPKKKKYGAVTYYDYDLNTGDIVNLASTFDDMFWKQQYYNGVMRSAMNYHFQSILKEKGYNISVNEMKGQHKINFNELKEDIKEATGETIKTIIEESDDDELTAGQKKIKASIEKRANILHINIDNDKYNEELTDDRQFVTHLNICALLNTKHDDKLYQKMFEDFGVQNITSNANKIKLINEVRKIFNVSPLCVDNINDDIVIPDNMKKLVKDTFRIDANLVSMYRHLVPGIIKVTRITVDGKKKRVYEIEPDIIKHHIELLRHRNETFDGIDENILNRYGYEKPEPEPEPEPKPKRKTIRLFK